MKERPILFNQEMVRAILDGRKTQTRRVITHLGNCREFVINGKEIVDAQKYLSQPSVFSLIIMNTIAKLCPYGQPGDLLWVRETWAEMCKYADPYCECDEEERKSNHFIEYRADSGNKYPGDWDGADKEELKEDYIPKWHPSIFMPRAASRITLQIVNVRVERLQTITPIDATLEGMSPDRHSVIEFRNIWNSINAKKGFGWDTNPWVWVIEFEKFMVRSVVKDD